MLATVRRLLGALLLGLFIAPLANAQSLPTVNLGLTSFMDGGPPAGSGLYWQEYFQYYNASRFNDNNGNRAPLPDPHLNVMAVVTQFIYISPKDLPFLNAKPALDVLLPTVSPDLSFSAPVSSPRADGAGLGNLLIGPTLQFNPIMGSDGPLFVQRIEAQCILPSGRYSNDREINPSSGFFSFDPYWAGTLFFAPKWETSFRLHYLWNARDNNPDTIYAAHSTQAGEAFHMNWAVSYEVLEKKLRVGINGYWLNQTTDSQIDGISVPGQREQVFAYGPGLIWTLSDRDFLFINTYFETDVRNRPEGTSLLLRYVKKF